MLPIFLTGALKLGKKISVGLKQKKSLLNGAMAAKKTALQSSFVAADIPLANISFPFIPGIANDLKIKNNNQKITSPWEQKIKKFGVPVLGLLLLVSVIKFVFGKR